MPRCCPVRSRAAAEPLGDGSNTLTVRVEAIDGSGACLVFAASAMQSHYRHRARRAWVYAKSRRPGRRLQGSRRFRSDDPDVLGFLALAAGPDVELDGLALIEGLIAVPLDVGVVDEDVVAALARNEAEALLGVEELDGTCSQN